MAKFKEIYLTSYFIGEGLSGFFPSIIALAQGVGGNPECRNGTEPFTPEPRFSVDIFFYMLFVFTLISVIAFYCMNLSSIVSGAYSQPDQADMVDVGETSRIANTLRNGDGDQVSTSSGSCEQSVFEPPHEIGRGNRNTNESGSTRPPQLGLLDDAASNESTFLVGMSKRLFLYLIILQAAICLLSNGFFPAIQSYSCLPYGNVAYHLSVALSNMANPTVCLLAFFIPPPTKYSISVAAGLSILLSGYVMTTAVMSPSPPLMGQVSGEILLVKLIAIESKST